MDRIEVITRTERRRTFQDAEKAQILAETAEPGVTIRSVAQRHGISESVLYSWRSALRQAQAIASEPMAFIPYGVVADAGAATVVVVAAETAPAPKAPRHNATRNTEPDYMRQHPGPRPGSIDINLPDGVCISVDSYVNEKALARVFRALREAP